MAEAITHSWIAVEFWVAWLVGSAVIYISGVGCAIWLIDRVITFILRATGAYALLAQAAFQILKERQRRKAERV